MTDNSAPVPNNNYRKESIKVLTLLSLFKIVQHELQIQTLCHALL